VARSYEREKWQKHDSMGKFILPTGRQNINVLVYGRNWSDDL
jgi:hypothetical protein